MNSISNFDANVYSEESYNVTEGEYDAVMSEMASPDDYQGYDEWSIELESAHSGPMVESENLFVKSGRVFHKQEPRSLGRIGGIEL